MNEFIAYGGGVGSTTLILKSLKEIRQKDLEIVFIDHKCDLPETHQYITDIQQNLDIDITIRDAGSLYDYCWQHKIIPSIRWRWCTDKFKIRPMKAYTGKDKAKMGLTFDERWRVKDFFNDNNSLFPLIQHRISRHLAIKEIEKEKINIPCKSGCYFCPFQNKERWRVLYFTHPNLFLKAIRLEDNARERNPNMCLYNKPLRQLAIEFKEQQLLLESTGEQP